MIWWRLTLDTSGAILTCDQVESAQTSKGHVRYIAASSKAEACSSAKVWFESVKARKRETQAKLTTERKKKRLCPRCGCKARLGKVLCQDCSDRQQAQKKSEHKTVKSYTPEQAKAVYDARQKHNSGWISLRSVLYKYDENPNDFRAWLIESIQQYENDVKEAAK